MDDRAVVARQTAKDIIEKTKALNEALRLAYERGFRVDVLLHSYHGLHTPHSQYAIEAHTYELVGTDDPDVPKIKPKC